MNSKLIGGILLIIGTSIGGGMLALPASAAPAGFWNASLLLFACWVLMTFSALLILEVNLWLPRNSNIISMAHATLGKPGEILAWVSYMFLLYCLISAYISSGTDVLNYLLALINIHSSLWFDSLLFVMIFGFIVYKGIHSVDLMNRGLMAIKLISYTLLVILIVPHVDHHNLQNGPIKALLPSVTVMITSYGFATIIPSLRSYFHDDIKMLRLAILIGSFIPLVCYILWICVFLGVVPHDPNVTLYDAIAKGRTTSDLINSLSEYLHSSWITYFARVFTSVCVGTSFLGVSLGLTDFLADGLKIHKSGKGAYIIYSLTFLPPLLIVLWYPDAFILGLSYAGVVCIILLALLPALMAWSGRYRKHFVDRPYQVVGGKTSLILLMTASVAAIILSFVQSV